MLQIVSFAAITLFTAGVVGAVIKPLLQREGITLTRSGTALLALLIVAPALGVSLALFPELPEIAADEPVAPVVKQEKSRTVTRADILAARAVRLANEASERAYRVGVETAIAIKGEEFTRWERVENHIAGIEAEAARLQGLTNTYQRLQGANETLRTNRSKAGVVNKLYREINRLED